MAQNETLERYEICRQVGCGGEGQVFLVMDRHLNRMAAMKYIQTSQCRFWNEVRLLRQLPAGVFPVIYDAWYSDQRGVLVMEYIEGITGKEYLQHYGTVPVNILWKWGCVLAETLREMHGRNPQLFYRDLKPENIMIQEGDKIRMIDTGSVADPETIRHEKNIRTGTGGFSAPEQWAGEKIDAGADIYSLGTVLYYLLTGKMTAGEVRCGAGGIVPPGMKEILIKCMQSDRKNRYPSMEAFLKDWKSWNRIGKRKKAAEIMFRGIQHAALAVAAFLTWVHPEKTILWGAALFWFLAAAFYKHREEKKESWWIQEKTVWFRNG